MEGDDYQALFFWREAAGLLDDNLRVERVEVEHDAASGVDDVAVFYRAPWVADRDRDCAADFFQVKYHVDRRGSYSADALIDPGFINATRSLLARLFDAYERLRDDYGWFRLNLVSNWPFDPTDPLASSLRERDGRLPAEFLTSGRRTAMGKVRVAWQEHLDIDSNTFEDFAARLRFGLDHFGRRDFHSAVSDRLASVGLRRTPADRLGCPYEDLARKFIESGTTAFDRDSLLAICRREGLVVEPDAREPRVVRLGIRSYLPFAERIEDKTDRHVCVARFFDGRHILDPAHWAADVRPAVEAFLRDPTLRDGEHELLLECVGTLAFLSGYELHRKSGAQVWPVQKGEHTQVWRPTRAAGDPTGAWDTETTERDTAAGDRALALSVSCDIRADVHRYLDRSGLAVRELRSLTPAGGSGPGAVRDAAHALHLAEDALRAIQEMRDGDRQGRIHLFAAAPNGLLFLLGRYRSALGPIQLYEFDYDGERDGSYSPSLSMP